MSQIKEDVKEYYGQTLQSSEDLKTTACCPADSMPAHLRVLVAKIHDEVVSKFYGCGSPIPFVLEGMTVLDLGCGTGRDCYILSQLVGEEGYVIGVDMTDEQLSVANKHVQYHMDKFGFKKTNVEFRKHFIEDLSSIEDSSVDVVVSNCVINLSDDKEAVFKEVFRVLKTGGELYFSDVFADRRIPEEIQKDKVILGECLGGALYIEDFRRLLRKHDCLDYRVVSDKVIGIDDPEIAKKVGDIEFTSKTIRTFKCDFEDICEDYGQVAYYRGGIEQNVYEFALDDHHIFKKDVSMLVCGNTAKMVSETRYSKYFEVIGNFKTHFGAFDCSGEADDSSKECSSGCCC